LTSSALVGIIAGYTKTDNSKRIEVGSVRRDRGKEGSGEKWRGGMET
jgi:hypothetical protein